MPGIAQARQARLPFVRQQRVVAVDNGGLNGSLEGLWKGWQVWPRIRVGGRRGGGASSGEGCRVVTSAFEVTREL